MVKVILAAGHGGIDPGAVYKGIQEDDLTLLITLLVGKYLSATGLVDVQYIRTTSAESYDRFQRARKANTLGDKNSRYIAIHTNAAGGDGSETYAIAPGGEGDKMAKAIQAELVALGFHNRGVKYARFTELAVTVMPAALVETLFIDNPSNLAILVSSEGQDKIARAIAAGFLKSQGVTSFSFDPEPVAAPQPVPVPQAITEPKEIEVLRNRVTDLENRLAKVPSIMDIIAAVRAEFAEDIKE